MSKIDSLRKIVYVITMVSLGEDPLDYPGAIGVFVDEQMARQVLKELEADLDGEEGIQYFVEDIPLDERVIKGV